MDVQMVRSKRPRSRRVVWFAFAALVFTLVVGWFTEPFAAVLRGAPAWFSASDEDEAGVVEVEHDGYHYTLYRQGDAVVLLRSERIEDHRARKAVKEQSGD